MELRSLEDTRQLARHILDLIPHSGLLLLAGPMGAGKTTLTSFLAQELASEANVSSPTYTLVHEYPSPSGALVHMDLYRLPDSEAAAQLGLDDYLERSRLVVVEWGEPLLESYPEAWLLRLSRGDGARRAELVGPGRERPA